MEIEFDPKDPHCVACGKSFIPSKRKQGGGKTQIYCSHNCCKNLWKKKNTEKRKVHIKKYQATPKGKETRRWIRVKRYYNLSKEQYYEILNRQSQRCLGCDVDLNSLSQHKIHLDHSHNTGKIRGFLCDWCNRSLGLVKENRQTLHKLSSYLDVDRARSLIYIVGSLRNNNVTSISHKLREIGYDVFDDWKAAGEKADDAWQEYEMERGHGYKEALNGRAAHHVFYHDKSYLDLSDGCVLVRPCGKSAHLELGYLIAKHKPGWTLLDGEPDRFDVMQKFAKLSSYHMNEILDDIQKTLPIYREEMQGKLINGN